MGGGMPVPIDGYARRASLSFGGPVLGGPPVYGAPAVTRRASLDLGRRLSMAGAPAAFGRRPSITAFPGQVAYPPVRGAGPFDRYGPAYGARVRAGGLDLGGCWT
jgi:hypothetical protein